MNDDFATNSSMSSFLPEDYGEDVSSEVRKVSAGEPDRIFREPVGDVLADDYGGWLKDKLAARKDRKATKAVTEEEERAGFLSNLSNLFGGSSDASTDPGYRDLTDGGYTYRQYPGNGIEIMATPTGRGIGTLYTDTSEAGIKVRAKWGPYPYPSSSSAVASKSSKKRATSVGAGVGAGISTFFSTLLSSQTPSEAAWEDESAPTDVGVSWTPYIVGSVVLVAVGTGLYFMFRNKED